MITKCIGTIRRFLEHYADEIHSIVFCVRDVDDEEIYERLLPLYFPRSIEEEKRSASKLRQNIGLNLH